MKRATSPAICADCMKLHRRLSTQERVERRAALVLILAGMRASDTAKVYALALYDHLTLTQKVWEPGNSAHPAPAIPSEWSGAQLDRADRVVLGTLHQSRE